MLIGKVRGEFRFCAGCCKQARLTLDMQCFVLFLPLAKYGLNGGLLL